MKILVSQKEFEAGIENKTKNHQKRIIFARGAALDICEELLPSHIDGFASVRAALRKGLRMINRMEKVQEAGETRALVQEWLELATSRYASRALASKGMTTPIKPR